MDFNLLGKPDLSNLDGTNKASNGLGTLLVGLVSSSWCWLVLNIGTGLDHQKA